MITFPTVWGVGVASRHLVKKKTAHVDVHEPQGGLTITIHIRRHCECVEAL